MTKLIWRVRLVTEMGTGVVSETEMTLIEPDDLTVPETPGLTLEDGKRAVAAIQTAGICNVRCCLMQPLCWTVSYHRAFRAHPTDICCVLKEPTLAIDFTAHISGPKENEEECLKAVGKSILMHSGLIGE